MVVSHMLQRQSDLEEESQAYYGDMVFVFIDQEQQSTSSAFQARNYGTGKKRWNAIKHIHICVLWLTEHHYFSN